MNIGPNSHYPILSITEDPGGCGSLIVIINNCLYDVSSFVHSHPGGAEIIVRNCGKDATSEFEKSGHSAYAKNLLVSFFVGYADVSGAFEPSQPTPRAAPPLVANSSAFSATERLIRNPSRSHASNGSIANGNAEEENPVVQSVLPDLSDLSSNIMGLAPNSDPPHRRVIASDLALEQARPGPARPPSSLSFLRPRERTAVIANSNSGSDSPEQIADAPLPPPPPPPPSPPGLPLEAIVPSAAGSPGTGGRRWGSGRAVGRPVRLLAVPPPTPEKSPRTLSDSTADDDLEAEAEAHAHTCHGIADAAAGANEPLVAAGAKVSHPAAATAADAAPASKRGFGWAMMARRPPPLSPSLSESAISATSSLSGAEGDCAPAALPAKALPAAAKFKLRSALLPVALLSAWKSDGASGGSLRRVRGGSVGGGNSGSVDGGGGGGGVGKIPAQPSHGGGPYAPRAVRNSLLARSAAWQSLWAHRAHRLPTPSRNPTAAQVLARVEHKLELCVQALANGQRRGKAHAESASGCEAVPDVVGRNGRPSSDFLKRLRVGQLLKSTASFRDKSKGGKPVNSGEAGRDGRLAQPIMVGLSEALRKLKLVDLQGRLLAMIFGIRAHDVKNGVEGSRVIHPSSAFNKVKIVLHALLLVYSAAVVPVQLSFWQDIDVCHPYPTIYFDVFADTCFIVDLMLNFFVGVYCDGVYCDDSTKIARQYLSSINGFWFDIITSVPISYVEAAVVNNCASTSYSRSDGLVRALKILRMFKLWRMIRIFDFIIHGEDLLCALAGPIFFKILRLGVLLLCGVHCFTCAFWRTKIEFSDESQLEEFVTSRNVSMHDTAGIYVICCYFILTVFTTVGFGDITPANTGERLFTFFLFGAAVCLFGTLISQLNEIFVSSQRETEELNLHLDNYVSFMRNYGVPIKLELDIRKWVRFQFTSERKERKKHEVLSDSTLPEHFRLQLARSLQRDLFVSMPYFNEAEDRPDMKASFCAELLLKAEMLFFPARAVIADSRQDADSLMIVASGHVELHLPMVWSQDSNTHGTRLRSFKRGDVFGENAILGDRRWAGAYGVDADFVAGEHCSIARIRTNHIQGILKQFEFWPIKRRLDRAGHNLAENLDTGDTQNDHSQTHRFLSRIPFLNNASTSIREAFCSEVLAHAEMQTLPIGAIVADSREVARGMVVVASGSVSVYAPSTEGHLYQGRIPNYGMLIRVFKRGDVFGDTTIIGDQRWGGSYGVDADFIAGEQCCVAWIWTHHIQNVLNKPEFLPIRRRIQWAGSKFDYTKTCSNQESQGRHHKKEAKLIDEKNVTLSFSRVQSSGKRRPKVFPSSKLNCATKAALSQKATFLFIFFARRLLHGREAPPRTVFNWIRLARCMNRHVVAMGKLRKQSTFKIVLLGDAGVGKSSLITKFVDGAFTGRSVWNVGVELRTIIASGESIQLQIWNTAGQERFRSVAPSFYSGARGLMVVYDITSQESMSNVRKWMQDARRKTRFAMPIIFIGNKLDLDKERSTSSAEGLELAKWYGASFQEVSARTGEGVEEAFRHLASAMLAFRDRDAPADSTDKSQSFSLSFKRGSKINTI